MTSIASILTMHTLKRSENLKFLVVGLMVCVLVYYLKDLSLALGKTGEYRLSYQFDIIIALSFLLLLEFYK